MSTQRLYQIICQAIAGPARAAVWPALTESEWQALAALALAEGVAPLWHATLAAGRPSVAIPAGVRAALAQAYYTAAAHSLVIEAELARLASAVPDTPLILLKGAALARTVYADPALRPLTDLDVLVPADQVLPVVTAAQKLGYREIYPEIGPGVRAALAFHTYLRGGPGDQVALEVHWDLVAGAADWRRGDGAWFQSQAEPWPGAEAAHLPGRVWHLNPTATLLHLAAHLMLQHGAAQARLIWYADIHRLVLAAGDRLEWALLVQQATAWGWAAAVHAALVATQARLSTPLPPPALAELQAAATPRTARLVQAKADPRQTRLTLVWDKLAAMEAPARRRLVWGLLFPSAHYVRWRYQPRPPWLWPLLYPYRWLDVLGDVARTAWRRRDGRGRPRPWGRLVLVGVLGAIAIGLGVQAAAAVQQARVVIDWATASELNTAGFNLYRAENAAGPPVKINATLIPAATDALLGARYVFTDSPLLAGATYFYWLEEVELAGTTTRHGPTVVTARFGGGLPAALAAVCGLAGLGLWLGRPQRRP